MATLIGAAEQGARGTQISGTYEKTPESVRLRDDAEAIVTMLDVTLHADTRQVFNRVRDLRMGQCR